MRPTCWLRAAGVLTFTLLAHPGQGDILRFKNGTRLRGTIIKRTSTELTVQLPFGTTTFAVGDIVAVEPEEPPLPDLEPPVAVEAAVAVDAPPLAPPQPAEPPPAPPREAPPALGSGQGAPAVFSVERITPAIAMLVPYFSEEDVGVGSGAVITNNGLVVTNNHVVAGAERLEVYFPRQDQRTPLYKAKPYEARVLKTDPCHDLALVQVPAKTPVYLPLADDAAPRVGEVVYALGNPQGLAVSTSKGVISAIYTGADIPPDQLEAMVAENPDCAHFSTRKFGQLTLLLTDASFTFGSSGGPLVNDQGQIVGINTLISLTFGGHINFSVHVKHLRELAGAYLKD